MYIWQQPKWPAFAWDERSLAPLVAAVSRAQGRLLGKMEALGFALQREAYLRTLTEDVVKTSEIEGEALDAQQVRSSLARRLGVHVAGLVPTDRHVDGIVDLMLDATEAATKALTKTRLFRWHALLFPVRDGVLKRITVGAWRNDKDGPMQVVSGPIGRQRVHFQAPPAKRVPKDMDAFLTWFAKPGAIDPLLMAGIVHLWFVTIHPFDDGNGRIARAIADMALARADGESQRFYSTSAQIRRERNDYYDMLERTQKGELDVTPWLEWFLNCSLRAIASSEETLAAVLQKARFWERFAKEPLNQRQIQVLNRMLDGFEGKLTTSKWAKLAKCSQDTAYRDILDLIERKALRKDAGGGRSTSYSLVLD